MTNGAEVTIFFPDFHLRPNTREVSTTFLTDGIERVVGRYKQNNLKPRVVFLGDLGENYLDKNPSYLVNSNFGIRLAKVLVGTIAVLVRGNHDPEFQSSDIKALGFQAYTDCLKIESGGKTFFVEHGDKVLEKAKNGKVKEGKTSAFFDKVDNVLCSLLSKRMMSYMHRLAFNVVFPLLGKKYHLGSKWNDEIVKYTSGEKFTLITGHTHYTHINSKVNYVNPGCYLNGHIPYVVLKDGEVLHFKEKL